MPLTDYFPNAHQMLSQLKSNGARYGVTFNHMSTMPNTNKALQVAEYAKTVNLSSAYNKAMFKAVFEDDLNISLEDVIIQIGLSVGMNEHAIKQVLKNDTYRQVLEDNKLFCHQNAINSVPTFIINGEKVIVGAQDIQNFRRTLDHLNTKQ